MPPKKNGKKSEGAPSSSEEVEPEVKIEFFEQPNAENSKISSKSYASLFARRTKVLNNEEVQQVAVQQTNPQLIMIGPSDVVHYGASLKKLKEMKEYPNESTLIQFIEMKNQKHGIKNVRQLKKVDKEHFWGKVVPFMMSKIIEDSQKIACKAFMLPKFLEKKVEIYRYEVFLILCHMFFGTFPSQELNRDVSFGKVMTVKEDQDQVSNQEELHARSEKLKCLLSYFIKMEKFVNLPQTQQKISIIRTNINFGKTKKRIQASKVNEFIHKRDTELCEVKVQIGNLIDYQNGNVIVIYANGSVGKEVFSDRLVQNQESVFYTHPELMLLKVIGQQLQGYQALVVHGMQRFTETQGDNKNFNYCRVIKQDLPLGSPNMHDTTFAFVNVIKNSDLQYRYRQQTIQGDLLRAVSAFRACPSEKTIVTGGWMSQKYKLDWQLNFIVQWMAASLTGRELLYLVSESSKHRDREVKILISQMKQLKVTTMIEILKEYYQLRFKEFAEISILQYIKDFV